MSLLLILAFVILEGSVLNRPALEYVLRSEFLLKMIELDVLPDLNRCKPPP